VQPPKGRPPQWTWQLLLESLRAEPPKGRPPQWTRRLPQERLQPPKGRPPQRTWRLVLERLKTKHHSEQQQYSLRRSVPSGDHVRSFLSLLLLHEHVKGREQKTENTPTGEAV
jgi:hypothetical protein